MTLSEQFGANLQRLRLARGWSQGTLGRVAGLHRTEIQKLEYGLRDPQLRTVVKLARAMGEDPALLVAGLRL